MTLAEYINAVIAPCMAVFCGSAAVYVIVTRKSDPKSAAMLTCALLTGLVLNVSDAFSNFYNGVDTSAGISCSVSSSA